MTPVNRHALVCGASRGIGAAVAHALARDGLDVTLLARSGDALREVAGSLPATGNQQHSFIVADVGNTDELQSSVAARSAERPIQVLVNNSGGPAPGTARHSGRRATTR